jgi:hypothetical protein
MKDKKVKESKNYLIKKCKLLEKTISKLLEFISDEHNLSNEELDKLYKDWLLRKSRLL